jgi:nicotinamide-nucleotide amidase
LLDFLQTFQCPGASRKALHGKVEFAHFPQGDPLTDDIIALAAQAGHALQAQGLLLATAESCSGGGIAYAVTEVPGSSAWLDCGFVTYSNAAKTAMLNVAPDLIARCGAVSEPVAAAMAEGAVANSEAQVAVATTGIAGPGGAVPGKPVGTVCFGWRHAGVSHTETRVFAGDRHAVREQTIVHALQGVLRLVGPDAA